MAVRKYHCILFLSKRIREKKSCNTCLSPPSTRSSSLSPEAKSRCQTCDVISLRHPQSLVALCRCFVFWRTTRPDVSTSTSMTPKGSRKRVKTSPSGGDSPAALSIDGRDRSDSQPRGYNAVSLCEWHIQLVCDAYLLFTIYIELVSRILVISRESVQSSPSYRGCP